MAGTWQEAKVLIVSAIREAVNVYPLEYLVARHLAGRPAGALVLSEFSGFSRVLNGALSVNPWSLSQLQSSIDQAPAEMCQSRDVSTCHPLHVSPFHVSPLPRVTPSTCHRLSRCRPPRWRLPRVTPSVCDPFHVSQALEMPPAEMEARSRKDLAHIHSNTSEDWGRRYADDGLITP